MIRRTGLVAGAVVALGSLTWLWVGSRSVDLDAHERYATGLRELRRLERTLDADVLRTRFQLLNTYDPIVATSERIAAVRSILHDTPGFLSPEDRAALEVELAPYDALLDESARLVEDFKTRNAVLKNSLRYLPTLAAELVSDAERFAPATGLSAQVHGILEDVLVYNLTSDEEAAPRIEAALAALVESDGVVPEEMRPRVARFVAHVHVILTTKPEVDGIVRALTDLPMAAAEDRVADTYGAGYARAERVAHTYRTALYGLSVLLLVLVAVSFVRLRRALSQLATSNATLEARVAARTDELSASMNRYRQLVESTRAVPWEADFSAGRVLYLAPQAADLFGHPIETLVAGAFFELPHVDDRLGIERAVAKHAATGGDAELRMSYRIVTGSGAVLHVTTFLRRDTLVPTLFRGITVDVTREAQLELELRQAQKLEAVGRLAAGVAHEINTPVQFVGDSLHFVRDAIPELTRVLRAADALRDAATDGDAALAAARTYTDATIEADVEYLVAELPKALDRSLEGLDRVARIVRSMKDFAHPDQAERIAVDINRAIESTLTIARNEYKYVADLETSFGDLPAVVCHPGEINQVVLNLVVNAAHAISDHVAGTDGRGRIAVRTRTVEGGIEIQIEDTGGGVPEGIRERIFDPFFTTKAVGRGTGQGLAIARSIVVDKHHGTLRFDSVVGEGTTFYVTLPVAAVAMAA